MIAGQRVLSGRYRLDDEIGRGGMATVYRGYDETLDRPVAVKILEPDLARDAAFRTRFRLEAQAASRMSHPTIVRVFDAGEDIETDASGTERSVPYIVMELVEGRTLRDVVGEGPLSVDDAVRHVDGILDALEYSHRAGVVHRDIKPGNVMLTPAGGIKVMDFGIARAVSDSSSTVAETTQILGTAAYFSPEQAKGDPVDARTDLYSAGVVLFELLTGRQPFRGDTAVAVAYQHVSEAPTPPSEIADGVPHALDAVVLRALAKDPFERFATAGEFREVLQAAASGATVSQKRVDALAHDLYGPDPKQAQATARTLRQLGSDSQTVRTQSGPPVAWVWAAVGVVAAVVAALLFWVVTMQAPETTPTNARAVPDLVEMPWERAEADLQELELAPVRETESSATIPEGYVIRTDPGAGTSVSVGQSITVTVSTGADTVAMPTVTGLTEDEARESLGNAGLEVGQVFARAEAQTPAGVVLEASVDADTEVERDTVVDLYVANGRVALADLSGFTLDRAQQELDTLGLSFDVQDDPECPATTPATVTRMSEAPGDVPVDATVVLYACTG